MSIADWKKKQEYNPLMGDNNDGTMVFRCYPNLTVDDIDVDVKALLGLLSSEKHDRLLESGNKILNDSWTMNLKKVENDMSFLNEMPESLKRIWKENVGLAVNVTDELKELLKVYTDAEDHLKRKEADKLNSLTIYMQSYLNAQEKRKEYTEKLKNLQSKLAPKENCDDCEDDEYGDDE